MKRERITILFAPIGRARRASFTLIEVLLALVLSTLVVSLTGRIAVQVAGTRETVTKEIAARERTADLFERLRDDVDNRLSFGIEAASPVMVFAAPEPVLQMNVLAATSDDAASLHLARRPAVVRYRRAFEGASNGDKGFELVREVLDATETNPTPRRETIATGMKDFAIDVWVLDRWLSSYPPTEKKKRPTPFALLSSGRMESRPPGRSCSIMAHSYQTIPTATRRSAFVLLATLLLLTLLLAVTAQLATVTSTESVIAVRRHQSLTHDLAVDSALLVVGQRLKEPDDRPSDLIRALDERGIAETSFDLGECKVRCVLRDDGAKFNPVVFSRKEERSKLERALTSLEARRSLPAMTVALRPILTSTAANPMYAWFDQVFGEAAPGTFFRLDRTDTAPVWSDVVTLWGDGRLALRRVSVEVLDAALADLQPGLGKNLLALRPVDRRKDFLGRSMIEVPAELQQAVATRLAFDTNRYSLEIETALGGDCRRWYVVAQFGAEKVTTLHRSAITW